MLFVKWDYWSETIRKTHTQNALITQFSQSCVVHNIFLQKKYPSKNKVHNPEPPSLLGGWELTIRWSWNFCCEHHNQPSSLWMILLLYCPQLTSILAPAFSYSFHFGFFLLFPRWDSPSFTDLFITRIVYENILLNF